MKHTKKRQIIAGLMLATSILCGNVIGIAEQSVAHASVVETIEGTPFWNGDLKFPFYEMGNAIGNVLDLSSAYIESNDKRQLVIVVNSLAIGLNYNTIEATAPIKYIENKKNGTIAVSYQNNHHVKTVKDRMEENAFYYMKDYLNRK